MTASEFYAHTPNSKGAWQPLECHLLGVAQKSALRAAKFGAETLGYMVGLLHDIGKFRPEFQNYLGRCHADPTNAKRGEVVHSPFGCFFCEGDVEFVWPAIAGHHSSLYQLDDNVKDEYLAKHSTSKASLSQQAEDFLSRCWQRAKIDEFFTKNPCLLEPLLRMLFSCLVDADSEDSAIHAGTAIDLLYPSLSTCSTFFDLAYTAKFGHPHGALSQIRHSIYERALTFAQQDRGFFRLTAPTGSGKTLASLAFALRHAVKHAQIQRIIYAAPYTSIIDQTANEYRKYLPPEAILEHHSAIQLSDTESQATEADRLREAMERWEAPVIVTTTVQLFESLFANGRSRCRKLHNICNSIIILDEAQCLPSRLLDPTLDMLQSLVLGFGSSVLLCTATQPALTGNTPLKNKLPESTEIASEDVPGLFRSLKRVNYNLDLANRELSVAELADIIRGYDTVLVVVNTKRLATDLYQALGDQNALHLSTLLCPAHRQQVIRQIKERSHSPCRVISTQVVEAGVDIDFPVVFREFGPLDRMVQAAGRCNRNGVPGQPPFGTAYIFRVAGATAPPGEYSLAIQIARRQIENGGDLQTPELYEKFFRLLYRDLADTGQAIQERRSHFDYPMVAGMYKVIAEDTVPLVVKSEALKNEEAAAILSAVQAKGFAGREDWRTLQQYAVSVRSSELGKRFSERDIVRDWIPGVHLWQGYYHPRLGLGETITMAIEDQVFEGQRT